MTSVRPSSLPLIFMVLWYVLLLLGTGSMFLIGLIFGSEVYRDDSMPIMEWVVIAGPFLLNVALLVLTITFWNSGRRNIAYALTGVSVLIAFGFLSFFSGALI